MWFSRTLHLHSACCWFCLLLLSSPLSTSCPDDITSCVELEGSPLGHLVQERRSGRLFVGGVNVLYQLSPQLEVLGRSRTGPKMDAQDCLPPIVLQDCPSARMTDNHNKILLLEETEGPEGPEEAEGPQGPEGPEGPGGPEDVEGAQEGGLIVCGSVFQGICERRSMENISELLYTTPHPFDTQYVAANDPRVSTVAVIITTAGKQEVGGASQLRLMLVGRGYTSKGTGDIPPVTARRLSPVAPPRLAFSQEEELGKLVVGSYSQYNNQFVKAFKHGRHVYFLFSRRDAYHRKEYASYVSRLCASDRSFSSYVETPLRCVGGFNVATGASLAAHLDTPALFVTMAAGQASTPVATGRSALCVFKMAELDAMMRKAQEVCYTQAGKGSDGQEEAYIEYGVSSTCLRLPKDSVVKYPCGGEHTPSPIASARPVAATPTVTTETLLTAVTTTTEAGHTIALLGDREGNVHKAVLRSDGSAQIYSSVAVDTGSVVHADLLLDQRGEHVYVLTHSKMLQEAAVSAPPGGQPLALELRTDQSMREHPEC